MAIKRGPLALAKLHRWIGLGVMLWLVVLGLTGWAIAQREARWIHQWTVPEWLVSDRWDRLATHNAIRHFAIDEEGRMLGGSQRGLWRSTDSSANWEPMSWRGYASGSPQVLTISKQPDGLFLATDDGIWRADMATGSVERVALPGEHVSYMSAGVLGEASYALIDQKEVLRIDLKTGDQERIDIGPVTGAPTSVEFNRVAREVHEGVGLFPQPYGVWINDFGGIALAILGTTGLVMWLVRNRRFRSPEAKRASYRFSRKAHATWVGLISSFSIFYLSLTGLYLNTHWIEDLGADLRLSTTALPSVYSLSDPRGEIREIAGSPSDPQRFWLLARYGILETRNGGRTFALVDALPSEVGFDHRVFSLVRSEDRVYTAVGGKGVFEFDDAADQWRELNFAEPLAHMTSVSNSAGLTYFKDNRAVYVAEQGRDPEKIEFSFLNPGGMPMQYFLLDLHLGSWATGLMGYCNDAAGLGGLFLTVTGLILWIKGLRRKKRRTRSVPA